MSISSDLLIWDYGVNHLTNNLAGTETLNYYIHDESYSYYPIGSGYGSTSYHESYEEDYIVSVFDSIDPYIDLDFTRVYTDNGSDLDIYCLDYHTGWSSNTVGETTSMGSGAASWFDIAWKFTFDWDNDRNTIIHEIGHSLGVDHPDGDGFNSAYTSDDTVMSYNIGLNGWSVQWTQSDIDALVSIWGEEDDNTVNNLTYTSPSYDSRIYNLGNGSYRIETDQGIDVITGTGSVIFSDQSLDIINDIQATFDQVTGMDTVDGVIFRLYNAAFSRLPDPGGLENWIIANDKGGYSYQETAVAFIESQESINRYGSGQGDTDYINTVYNNVLDRDADSEGLAHYQALLSSGEKSRAEMMFDFSESPENRDLFSEQTGIT